MSEISTNKELVDMPTSLNQFEDIQHNWVNLLLLRPYGQNNLTPKVRFWLGCSLLIIFFMSILEGLTWGLVSQSLVAESGETLRITVASIVFFFVFCLIWIADASFILFQSDTKNNKLIWGISFRVVIIMISLLVTAPMLTQVLRESDIDKAIEKESLAIKTGFISNKIKDLQASLKTSKAEKERLDKKINTPTNDVEEYRQKKKNLEAEIAHLKAKEKNYEDRKEMEYFGDPEQKIKAGKGPRYFEAVKLLNQTKRELKTLNKELKALISPPKKDTKVENKKLAETNQTITLRQNELTELQSGNPATHELIKVYGEDLANKLPANGLGYRIQVLKQLIEKDNIPHWQSVEGLAQALLSILFLTLIALKLFQPEEAHCYFNEKFQEAWSRYKQGKLDGLPVLDLFITPGKSYTEFTVYFQKYLLNFNTYMKEHERQMLLELENKCERAELSIDRSEAELEDYKKQLEIEKEHIKNKNIQLLAQEKIENDVYLSHLKSDLDFKQQKTETEVNSLRDSMKIDIEERQLDNQKNMQNQELHYKQGLEDIKTMALTNNASEQSLSEKQQRLEQELKEQRELVDSDLKIKYQESEQVISNKNKLLAAEINEHQAELEHIRSSIQIESEESQNKFKERRERLVNELKVELKQLKVAKETQMHKSRLKYRSERLEEIRKTVSIIEADREKNLGHLKLCREGLSKEEKNLEAIIEKIKVTSSAPSKVQEEIKKLELKKDRFLEQQKEMTHDNAPTEEYQKITFDVRAIRKEISIKKEAAKKISKTDLTLNKEQDLVESAIEELKNEGTQFKNKITRLSNELDQLRELRLQLLKED